MKTLIIIPVYNESLNIQNVISDIRKNSQEYDILIINDASEDNTGQIVKSFTDIIYIELCYNLGIGGTVQTGFKYASYNDYDLAIQFDGDGQHKAKEIKKLLEPLSKQECDMVIGSRFLKKDNKYNPKLIRKLGIKYLGFIISVLTRKKFTDCTSGFRAYNKKTIDFLSRYYSADYPEPESMVILEKNKFKIKEVPVDMEERNYGESSIKGLLNIFYLFKVSLTLILNYIRFPIIK